MAKYWYTCSQCSKRIEPAGVQYLCPDCAKSYSPGVPLPGILEVNYDYEEIRHDYLRSSDSKDFFLPIEATHFPPIPFGNTPIHRSQYLEKQFDLSECWIKNDGLNPTGSLKDRASALVVAQANQLNIDTVVAASTGNAASALAAFCAASRKQSIIFVPASAPRAKLVQMILAGARIIPIEGTYDDAFRLSIEYTRIHGGLNRNTAYHPFTIEGKKTVGLELFRQLNGKMPDVIVIPVGDGVIYSAVHKAMKDLLRAGFISSLPRLLAVQAERSDAIHRYITTGMYADASDPKTIADSISVRTPSAAHLARRAAIESNGTSVVVSDTEILDAQRDLLRFTGVFAEPAAAAGLAGLARAKDAEFVKSRERVILLITGHGLKDIDTPARSIRMPASVRPDIGAIPT